MVLDNCEHVLDAAPRLAELIESCPGLTVLATSREPLRLSWERVYPIMPSPSPSRIAVLAYGNSAHIQLLPYLSSALRIRAREFQLTETNAPAVASICAALDGLPLALELAAGHARVLSPQAIFRRLQQRLDLTGRCCARPTRASPDPSRHPRLELRLAHESRTGAVPPAWSVRGNLQLGRGWLGFALPSTEKRMFWWT